MSQNWLSLASRLHIPAPPIYFVNLHIPSGVCLAFAVYSMLLFDSIPAEPSADYSRANPRVKPDSGRRSLSLSDLRKYTLDSRWYFSSCSIHFNNLPDRTFALYHTSNSVLPSSSIINTPYGAAADDFSGSVRLLFRRLLLQGMYGGAANPLA